jgi:hypothetical protein
VEFRSLLSGQVSLYSRVSAPEPSYVFPEGFDQGVGNSGSINPRSPFSHEADKFALAVFLRERSCKFPCNRLAPFSEVVSQPSRDCSPDNSAYDRDYDRKYEDAQSVWRDIPCWEHILASVLGLVGGVSGSMITTALLTRRDSKRDHSTPLPSPEESSM